MDKFLCSLSLVNDSVAFVVAAVLEVLLAVTVVWFCEGDVVFDWLLNKQFKKWAIDADKFKVGTDCIYCLKTFLHDLLTSSFMPID